MLGVGGHWTIVGHVLARLPFAPQYDLPGPFKLSDAHAMPTDGTRYGGGPIHWTFTTDKTKDTRMRIGTFMNMGITDLDDPMAICQFSVPRRAKCGTKTYLGMWRVHRVKPSASMHFS